MSDKLFGKYHDLFHLGVGFLLTVVLGAAVSWQVWKLQHATEAQEASRLRQEQAREDRRLNAEARDREEMREATRQRDDSLSRAFQAALLRQDLAHQAAQEQTTRAFMSREASIARASDSIQQLRGREEHRREVETSQATAAFNDISGMMDRRLYRLERVLWAYQLQLPQSAIDERNGEYQAKIHEWNESLNRNLAIAELSFGTAMRDELENGIASDFTCVHNKLRQPDPDTVTVRGDVGELRRRVYDFNIAMLTRIARRESGAPTPGYTPPQRICTVMPR